MSIIRNNFPKPTEKFFGIKPIDQVPLNDDLYLIDVSTIESINVVLESNNSPQLKGLYSVIKNKNSNYFDIEIVLDQFDRTHSYQDQLSLSDIIYYATDEDGHPYLFITSQRYKSFYRRVFSNFALVDLIGVKKIIEQNSSELTKLEELPKIIDRFAHNYESVFFFSFADSVWLKSNWTYFKTKNYDPENFLKLVITFQDYLKQETGLESYSIITQGANLYSTEETAHINKNHVSLLTLGTPFSTMYQIDRFLQSCAGKSVRNDIYLEASFYLSLNLYKNQFKPIKRNEIEFYPVEKSIQNILKCFETSKEI